MATEQLPLLFFKTSAGTDALAVAQALAAGSSHAGAEALDPGRILEALKATRGFARLKVALPAFDLDNPRAEASLEGTATETHLAVRFYGNFEKLAKPLFDALTKLGLTCYSVWDRRLLDQWPKSEEPKVDKGFAARMMRVMQRKTLELRQTVPDATERTRILNAFLSSPEFRDEMAAEARQEKLGDRR